MYQHQHAPLPLDQLEGVPQPVVVLLEVLLEKDPVGVSKPSRTSERDADYNRRYRRGAHNHSSELAEDASYRFACPHSQPTADWDQREFQ